MRCPICSLGGSGQREIERLEPSCSEIEKAVKESRVGFFTLSGGEPTYRSDINAIIRIFRKHKKTVAINTNGLKLVDVQYLKDLVGSGLGRINFQFDGFKRQTYLLLRGMDLLDEKLKALENLKSLGIPVVLNATISKNINEESISELIEYAASNKFINGVTFFTICNIGGARKWPLDNYVVPDEIVGIIEKQTNKRINSKNFYLFQKLHIALKSLFSHKVCLYGRVYVLVRNNKSYRPIDEFVNLEKLEPILDIYQDLCFLNQLVAKLYLSICLPVALLVYTSPTIIKELISTALSYFLKTGNYLKAGRFIYISVSTACDPYKVDYSMLPNCQNEIICMDQKTGRFAHQGSICIYGMKLEKPSHE